MSRASKLAIVLRPRLHAPGQVTYYDDIGAAYEWAVKLPVAAVSLDFLGVPGSAYTNEIAALIEKCALACAHKPSQISLYSPACKQGSWGETRPVSNGLVIQMPTH